MIGVDKTYNTLDIDSLFNFVRFQIGCSDR